MGRDTSSPHAAPLRHTPFPFSSGGRDVPRAPLYCIDTGILRPPWPQNGPLLSVGTISAVRIEHAATEYGSPVLLPEN